MRSARRFAAVGLFMLLALPATPASAHAAYKESSPANKSSVSAPPSEVWADFTEPPARSSRLEIYDPCGQRVDSGTWDITAYRITASMDSDKQGTYTARFFVTSDLDSHVTTGNFTFTSTGGAPCPGAGEEPQPAEEKPSNQGGDGGDDATGGGGNDDGSLSAAGADPGDVDSEEAAASTGVDSSKRKGGKHQGMDHKGKKKHGKGDHKGKAKGSKNRNKSRAAGPPVQGDETPPGSGDIPMDWLMISFGIAGAVGAAGGKVYAGLMGGPKP